MQKEFDIRKLLIRLLSNLKFIVIMVLLGALVGASGGVWAYVMKGQDTSGRLAENPNAIPYNENLLEQWGDRLESLYDMQKKEIWLQVNPNNAPATTIQFIPVNDVIENNPVTVYTIRQAYVWLPTSEEMIDDINKKLGINLTIENFSRLVTVTTADAFVRLVAVYPDIEMSGKLADAVLDYAKEYISDVVTPHNITIYSRNSALIDQAALRSSQNQITEQINNLNRQISLMVLPVASKPVSSMPASYLLKNIVIGMMAFFALALMMLFLFQLVDMRVVTPLEIEERTQLPCLGALGHEPQKRSAIQAVIEKLRGNVAHALPYAERLRLAYASIMAKVGNEVTEILITGTIAQTELQAVCRDLNDMHGCSQGREIFSADPNILLSGETVSAIRSKMVVIAEAIGQSLLQEVDLEVKRIRELGVEPAGYVITDVSPVPNKKNQGKEGC